MQKRARESLFLMICTQASCVMICHYSVMDKKSRINMIRLFWCEKRDYALEFCKGKNRNFIYARNGTGSRTAVLGPYADLTIPRMVIQHRSRFKPRFKIRAQKKSSRSYSFLWCEKRDLNPYERITRPSNVRVYQFRHSRKFEKVFDLAKLLY